VRRNIENGHAFAEHLAKVLQLHPSENKPQEEEALAHLLDISYQLERPINRLKRSGVKEVIYSLKTMKTPDCDLINIPYTVIQLCHAKGILPGIINVAQIILILKPGKSPKELTSYRPIRLLPIIFNVFEKILLKRFLQMVENNR
jgi:hypothetical protein